MAALNFDTAYLIAKSSFFQDWLEAWDLGALIFVIVGMALLVTEMIIPGFGLPGVAGAACCLLGLVMGSDSILGALFSLAIILAVLIIAAVFVFKVVFNNKRKRKTALILNETIDSVSNETGSAAAKQLTGREGLTLTSLRPAGFAMINGRRLDVLAKGEFIEKGVRVRVCDVRGLRISVVKADSQNKQADEKAEKNGKNGKSGKRSKRNKKSKRSKRGKKRRNIRKTERTVNKKAGGKPGNRLNR